MDVAPNKRTDSLVRFLKNTLHSNQATIITAQEALAFLCHLGPDDFHEQLRNNGLLNIPPVADGSTVGGTRTATTQQETNDGTVAFQPANDMNSHTSSLTVPSLPTIHSGAERPGYEDNDGIVFYDTEIK